MTKNRRRAPRRVSIKPTVGLIVEGDTEFIAFPLMHIKKLVPNCPPLKPTNLKGVGSHLIPEAVAKLLAPKVIAHFVAGRTKVVVCIDLEDRNVCPGEFSLQIYNHLLRILKQKNLKNFDLHLVILNRSFESILLAGAESLYRKRAIKNELKIHSFEGKLGEQNKKGVVELSALLGRDYDKTTDGPKLFEKLDFAEARNYKTGGHGSKSFDKLLRSLDV